MKTKEFIERVEKSGFVATTHKHGTIRISRQDGTWLSSVDIEKQFDVSFFEHKHITPKIFSLIMEYASTPLEEREEEKKYIYRLAVPDAIGGFYALRTNGEQDDLRVGGTIYERYKEIDSYHFTDKEVEQFTGKNRALFNACEKIEVTP